MLCPMRKAGLGWTWEWGGSLPGVGSSVLATEGGLVREGGAVKKVAGMQLEAFPEPPTSLPSSLCVACSLSLTPSLLQSLFLASCSPAPRTVAAHTLPGYRDKEAGAGGLGRVALIFWGGGWKSVYPPNSRLLSQGLPPSPLNTHTPGCESQIEA